MHVHDQPLDDAHKCLVQSDFSFDKMLWRGRPAEMIRQMQPHVKSPNSVFDRVSDCVKRIMSRFTRAYCNKVVVTLP